MAAGAEKNQLRPQSYPWLVMRNANDGESYKFFSISENRYYIKIIPGMRDSEICTCAYGWLVIRDLTSKACHLLNPFSMAKIQLPRLEYDDDCQCCLLSTSPTDSNCYILFNYQTKIILFHQPNGDGKFVRKEIDDAGIEFSTIAMIQGKLYCLQELEFTQALMAISFKGVELEYSTQMLIEGFPWTSYRNIFGFQDYVIEASGELLLVHKMYFGLQCAEVRGFFVFRFDFSGNKWVKTDDLRGWTIFLTMRRGMACFAAESNVKRNSIYFIQPDETCLRVFDLEDYSFSMTFPCPTLSSYAEFDWVMMLEES